MPSSVPTVCSGQSLGSPPSCLSPGHTGAVVPCIYRGCVLGGIEPLLWLLRRRFSLLSSRNCVWEGAWEAISKGYSHKMRTGGGKVLGLMFDLVPVRNGEFPVCAGECQWSRFSEMPEASRDCRTGEILKPVVFRKPNFPLKACGFPCGLSYLGMRLGWSSPWRSEGMKGFTWRAKTRISPARVISNK